MSSFRRKTPVSTTPASGATAHTSSASLPVRRQLSGTKPFLNGQTLISSGLAQLDAILGGGLLLGTLVLLETPRSDAGAASTALVDDLHRYFCGEGIVAAQCAVIVAQDAASFSQHQLPLELSLAQKELKQQLAAMDVADTSDQQQHQSSRTSNQPDAKLTIAWQYGKYLAPAADTSQQQRFCHSFDLSRPMHRELLDANPPVLIDTLDAAILALDSPSAVYDALFERIGAAIASREAHQVLRISVRELGSPLFGAADASHMAALYGFVRKLRALVSARPVVCVLSGALAAFPVPFANEVRHMSDYVLELKAFMGEQDLLPAELQDFHGLLDIHKLARVHALACHAADARKFGVKRERRKLKIEKFHLPPEGSRSSSSSSSDASSKTSRLVGASAAHKAASGCGSSSASSSMDPLAF